MAFSKTIALFIVLAGLLSCSAAAREMASKISPLAQQVCAKTTDPYNCRQVFSSDSRGQTTESVVIAYISFGAAYNLASTTSDLIQKRINDETNQKYENLAPLTGCRSNYTESGRAMMEAIGNLDSETYSDFDKLAAKAEMATKDCEAGFNLKPSPMAKENGDMMKLANICSVVANLFSYSD